ncbi:hypothetical protein EMIT093MI4_10134 [Pseudomonas sp. IT-93MI4]
MAGNPAGDRRAVSQRTPGDHQDQPDGVPAPVHHPRQRSGAQHHPQPLRLHAPRPGRPATGTQLGNAGHAGAAVANGGAGGAEPSSCFGTSRDDQSGADRREHALLNPTLNLRSNPVVRGFIPDGQRSGPKTYARGQSDVFGYQVSGLLRSPSGINPLTTRIPLTIESRGDAGPVGAAEGCDLLLWLFSMSLKIKIKRPQPAAAPTRDCIVMGGGCR